MRLTLVCHAATAATRAAAFPGDEPADEAALARAAASAGRLRAADRCWTSPALRARQTAAALGLAAAIEPALRDVDHGRWAGRTLAEIEGAEPDALATWLGDPASAPHGGESLQQVLQRVAAWLDARAGEPGHGVAVTHAAVVRAALIHAIGAPPAAFWRIDVAPLSLSVLSHDGRHWRLRSLNEPA